MRDFKGGALTEEEKEAMLLEPLVREGGMRDFKVWVTTEEQRKSIIAEARARGLNIAESVELRPLPCGLIALEGARVMIWCDSKDFIIGPQPGASPEEALRRLQAFPRTKAGASDYPVQHPAHYTTGKIECIDYIEDKELGFHLGNAVKYITRAGKKDPAKTIEDLEKAVWYIQRKIELLKEGEG